MFMQILFLGSSFQFFFFFLQRLSESLDSLIEVLIFFFLCSIFCTFDFDLSSLLYLDRP